MNHAKRERDRDPIALFYSEGKVAKNIIQWAENSKESRTFNE